MAAENPNALPYLMTFPQQGETWPDPFGLWAAGEYPSGRGLAARRGWECPGCGKCWSPDVLACHACPPQPRAVSTRLGPGDEITDDDAER